MPKRLSLLVMLWLGLIWAASPAIACAPTAERDCCPAGTHTPCGGDESGIDLQAFAVLCCASAPVASPAAIANAPQATDIQPHETASPDSMALLAWFATLKPPEREAPPLPPDSSGRRADASLTYLHTLRLRL